MKTVLKSILVVLVSLPSLVPAAFAARTKPVPSTESECSADSISESDVALPEKIDIPFQPMLLCGVKGVSGLQIDVVDPSGNCPLQASGNPIIYHSFSGEEVRALVGLATSMLGYRTSNSAGETAKDPLRSALAEVFAAAFKADAVAASASFCQGPQPAPGTCGTDDPHIECCIGDPSGGSNSGGENSGGSSGEGGGSSVGGGGGGGETPAPRAFELIYLYPPNSTPSFIILEVTKRALATNENPFGICTPENGSSVPDEANYHPGTLKAAGCPPGFRFTPFAKFMGDMAVAGIAIAIPLALPELAPSLVIPGVAIGAAVLVGGYFLYQWINSGTPQQLLFTARVACQNLCSITHAAAQTAIQVGWSTIAILSERALDQIENALRVAARRLGELTGGVCCQILCTVFVEELMTEWEDACYQSCYNLCLSRSLKPDGNFCHGTKCEYVGMILGNTVCNIHK